MRLEKLFKVLVAGGVALGSTTVACSDAGDGGGQKPSGLGQGGSVASTGGATGGGGVASGSGATGGAVSGSGASAGAAGDGTGGNAIAEAGPDSEHSDDAAIATDAGAEDATSDGVDSWLSWFS